MKELISLKKWLKVRAKSPDTLRSTLARCELKRIAELEREVSKEEERSKQNEKDNL